MKICTLKSLLILYLIVTFTSPVFAEVNPFQREDDFTFGLRGKSFTVTFCMDEDKYTDTFIFGSDGSFIIASLSNNENSSGSYLDILGTLFFAHFLVSFPTNPLSLSFYGIYLSPIIFGINIIHCGGQQYIGGFFGNEVK